MMSGWILKRMGMPSVKIIKTRNSLTVIHQNKTLPPIATIHADFYKLLLPHLNPHFEIKWQSFNYNQTRSRKEARLLANDLLEKSILIHNE